MNAKVIRWPKTKYMALHNVVILALGTALLSLTAYGQTTQSTPTELDSALAAAKSGNLSSRAVEVIAKAKAVQAIQPLEKQFAQTTDLNTKAKIASGLVRLGVKNDIYWNFVLQQATAAVDSDIPDPFRDSTGHDTGRELSPDFKAWIQAHQIDASTAIHSVLFDLPVKVIILAEAGDPRGIPLLRRALQSHNYQIVAWAAKGLTKAQDKQSIPLIIAAIQAAPSDYTALIAESLVYFDDVLAQNAVDSYMPKEQAALDRKERARGRGVFGW